MKMKAIRPRVTRKMSIGNVIDKKNSAFNESNIRYVIETLRQKMCFASKKEIICLILLFQRLIE